MERACLDKYHHELFTFMSRYQEFHLAGPSKYISWSVIGANLDKEWNWSFVSHNPNVTWDIVQANPNLPWDYSELSQNPNITMDIIKQYIATYKWSPERISKNPNFTFEFLEWFLENHACTNAHASLDWESISSHKNITWDIIKGNPGKPWDFSGVSKNPNITWDIVLEHPEYQWDWYAISGMPFVTWDIVQKHPDHPWVWKALLSVNTSIPWEVIEANTDKPWKMYLTRACNVREQISVWDTLSKNPKITWDIVKRSVLYDLLYGCELTKNPNITWSIISKTNYSWQFIKVSFSTVLSLDTIKENLDYKWCWFHLGHNPSIYNPSDKYKATFIRQWSASNLIKKSWFRANTNPDYRICKKRLQREFLEL